MITMVERTVADLKREGRRGTITLSTKPLDDMDITLMSQIMSKLIIVRAEHMYMNDTITYECFSPEFRKVQECEKPPQYDVVLKLDTHYLTGGCHYTFVVSFKERKNEQRD